MTATCIKIKNKSWIAFFRAGPCPKEGNPFVQKLPNKYPDSFFYCTALRNYCVVIDSELFVCCRELNALQTVKKYFNSYFPLKNFKEEVEVFNAIHNIQVNVPTENMVAMIDAVKEFNGE